MTFQEFLLDLMVILTKKSLSLVELKGIWVEKLKFFLVMKSLSSKFGSIMMSIGRDMLDFTNAGSLFWVCRKNVGEKLFRDNNALSFNLLLKDYTDSYFLVNLCFIPAFPVPQTNHPK